MFRRWLERMEFRRFLQRMDPKDFQHLKDLHDALWPDPEEKDK